MMQEEEEKEEKQEQVWMDGMVEVMMLPRTHEGARQRERRRTSVFCSSSSSCR